jgi:ABC-type branched-subunit amino acid transport system ATPase component/ABC-type branched-subunit amino acid transport system permease subunit
VKDLARHPLLWLAGGLLVLPSVVGWAGTTVSVASEIALFALVGFGFNLLLGYSGLTSFGHGAYFGLAAYAMALTQLHLVKGIVAPIAAGVVVATALGAVLGFLVLRRRGVYFSLLTLAFTQMFFYIVYRWTAVTGGESGLGGIARPPVLGLDLADQRTFYWVTAAIVFVGAVVVWRVVHSPFGTVLQAIRENERRASFVGYDVRRYAWLAFVLSTTIAGLAGALHGLLKQFVYADLVHVTMSGEILAMTLVGGLRHFLGPAVGAAFFVLFREVLTSYTENWLLYFGLLFMAFILFSPDGILGVARRLAAPLRREAEALAAMAARAAPAPRADGPAAGAAAPGEVLLEAFGLVKRFGGLAAVDGVDLQVRAGELRGLIGPNGAGKTTLFNVLSGLFPPDAGAVHFRGAPITGLAPHRIVARGVSRSFQILTIFRELSVFENVRLAVQARSPHRFHLWRPARAFAAITRETEEIIRRVGLVGLEAAPASSLSYGGQRLLEIGIALATRPVVLLLDEPLAGLSPAERERVAAFIKGLARAVTVVLIEHDIDRVLALCDRITVLHLGRVIADGPPPMIQGHPEVRAAYLGGRERPRGPAAATPGARPDAEPLLALEGVDTYYGKSHILHGVSLVVGPGEVVALLGRNGAGKTATLNTITGLRPPRRGRIRFQGREIAGQAPERIARLGIGLAPQGRRIFPNLTVADNLRIARLSRGNGAGAAAAEARLLERFPKLRARWRVRADALSGGELQMLAIARALVGDVRLLILDEPFEGLAPVVVEEVYATVAGLRGSTAILLVEHNLDLALALADRVYVLDRGAVTHTGPASELLADFGLRARVLWF